MANFIPSLRMASSQDRDNKTLPKNSQPSTEDTKDSPSPPAVEYEYNDNEVTEEMKDGYVGHILWYLERWYQETNISESIIRSVLETSSWSITIAIAKLGFEYDPLKSNDPDPL